MSFSKLLYKASMPLILNWLKSFLKAVEVGETQPPFYFGAASSRKCWLPEVAIAVCVYTVSLPPSSRDGAMMNCAFLA